jgi:hypothetical protein
MMSEPLFKNHELELELLFHLYPYHSTELLLVQTMADH